jgi:hypothetical protein
VEEAARGDRLAMIADALKAVLRPPLNKKNNLPRLPTTFVWPSFGGGCWLKGCAGKPSQDLKAYEGILNSLEESAGDSRVRGVIAKLMAGNVAAATESFARLTKLKRKGSILCV